MRPAVEGAHVPHGPAVARRRAIDSIEGRVLDLGWIDGRPPSAVPVHQDAVVVEGRETEVTDGPAILRRRAPDGYVQAGRGIRAVERRACPGQLPGRAIPMDCD